MDSTNFTNVETLANNYDVSLDTLSVETVREAEKKLQKANTFRRRGVTPRANTLQEETVELLGADPDDAGTDAPSAGGDGNDVDTLSKSAAKRVLTDYDLETLNSVWQIEEEIETLGRKRRAFENRGVDTAAERTETEMAVLEAVKAEIQASNTNYEDVDTLADRATRDGLVIEANQTPDGFSLTTRKTGGSE
jgi:hypothetical protein